MKEGELDTEWSELPAEFDFQINNKDFSCVCPKYYTGRTHAKKAFIAYVKINSTGHALFLFVKSGKPGAAG